MTDRRFVGLAHLVTGSTGRQEFGGFPFALHLQIVLEGGDGDHVLGVGRAEPADAPVLGGGGGGGAAAEISAASTEGGVVVLRLELVREVWSIS